MRLDLYGFVAAFGVNVAHIEERRRCVTGVYAVRVSGGEKYTIARTYKSNLRVLADKWLGTEI